LEKMRNAIEHICTLWWSAARALISDKPTTSDVEALRGFVQRMLPAWFDEAFQLGHIDMNTWNFAENRVFINVEDMLEWSERTGVRINLQKNLSIPELEICHDFFKLPDDAPNESADTGEYDFLKFENLQTINRSSLCRESAEQLLGELVRMREPGADPSEARRGAEAIVSLEELAPSSHALSTFPASAVFGVSERVRFVHGHGAASIARLRLRGENVENFSFHSPRPLDRLFGSLGAFTADVDIPTGETLCAYFEFEYTRESDISRVCNIVLEKLQTRAASNDSENVQAIVFLPGWFPWISSKLSLHALHRSSARIGLALEPGYLPTSYFVHTFAAREGENLKKAGEYAQKWKIAIENT